MISTLLPACIVFSLLVFSPSVFASPIINEFSSGSSSDWIEIYNTGTSSANLDMYRLKDSSTNSKDLSGMLEAGSYISFSFNQWLNNAGDTVNLIFVEGLNETIVNQIPYGSNGGLCAPDESQTIGRLPDGWSVIKRFTVSSRDATNNNSQEAPCPTFTPSPTLVPTQTPTNTPTSTLFPSPTTTPSTVVAISTLILTPTRMSTITLTVSEKIISTDREEYPDILGVEDGEEEIIESSSTGKTNDKIIRTKSIIIALLFISAGIGLFAIASLLTKVDIWNKKEKK